ncbi:unnamed protein product [Brugia pahangi]|uniref:Ovule protein n=1 Tax=Brugia pahangi TaxID=6280 RepID=A0A0N4TM74_BRUPA|nr:unnamed protein product [Brugia pahangi]
MGRNKHITATKLWRSQERIYCIAQILHHPGNTSKCSIRNVDNLPEEENWKRFMKLHCKFICTCANIGVATSDSNENDTKDV